MKNSIKIQSKEGKTGVSVLAGFAFSMILCLLTAYIYKVLDLDFQSFENVKIVICILSSMSAGFLTGRQLREKGMGYGALTGIFFFILYFLIALAVRKICIANSLYILIICTVSGSIGGILGVNKKSKNKRKKRKGRSS